MTETGCYTIALYIRLSKEDSKVESLSIQNQRASLHKFADSLNVDGDVEVVEFVDNGYSGTNFERPAVQELLNLVHSFKVDCIIVKDFSRFGRNRIETGYFLERVFPLFHVRFISMNDDFDSADYVGDTGGMDAALKYLMNEYYSIDLSRKSKSALNAIMRSGKFNRINCFYGYRKSTTDNRLEIDEEAAETVRYIFHSALAGLDSVAIAKELYAKKVPTPGEYKASRGLYQNDLSRANHIWSHVVIRRILKDERYTGTYIVGKRAKIEIGSRKCVMKDESEWIKIPNLYPPIIPPEIFARVQTLGKHWKVKKSVAREYPLRGKVICGCCRHAMQRSGKQNQKYLCKHSHVDSSFPCHGLKIAEDELERLLFDVISKQAEIILNLDRIDEPGALELRLSEQSECDRKIQDCRDRKRRLFEGYVRKEIAPDVFKERNALLDSELVKIDQTLAALSAQTAQLRLSDEKKAALLKAAQEVAGTHSLTKELTDLLIEMVLVFPENRIEIVWKLKDFFMEEGQ